MQTPTVRMLPLLALLLAGCNNPRDWLPGVTAPPAPQPAAQETSADIHYRLGVRLASGLQGEPDPARAKAAFERAARLGHREAQYLLGLAHLGGQGTARDLAQALHWLEQAAVGGHGRAQYSLGDLFLNGRGVPAEEAWGVHWFARAAAQGDGQAQYALGVAYATGLGVNRDLGSAWLWLRLAQQQQQAGALAVLDKLREQIDAQQLAQAEARIQRWRPRRYTDAISPAEIRFLQYSLNALGFPAGTVDGLVGPNTRRAVAAFRASRQLRGEQGRITTDLIAQIRSALRSDA